MQLKLKIENLEKVFGPNDIVQGIISLTTPGNVLISGISVVLTAKSKYSFSPYLIVDTEHALEQTLFKQQLTLYSSEKTNPKPPLPAGPHQWAFRFRLPDNETSLPPSFGHVADTTQRLPVGYSAQTVRSSCSVLYNVTASLCSTDLPKHCANTISHYIFFWPNRYTELPDGPLPKAYRHSIFIPQVTPSIPFQKDETSFLKRLCKKVIPPQKFDVLDLVAHIPRYTILGQPFQVSLSISLGDDSYERPALILESVKYALFGMTRVGRSSSSSRHNFSRIALERHAKNLCTPFPEADHFIHLHTTAPVIPTIDATWFHTIREGGKMMGPLCPTFESELIARTYWLSIYLTVSCEGKLQTRRFEGGEIVLLPPRLDASVKKGPLIELGEGGIMEAGGDAALDPELAAGSFGGVPRVEADGVDMAYEVEGENGRGDELPTNDTVVGKGFLRRSNELEGGTPNMAELATTVQQ